jgi:hypothetical protein
MNKPHALKGWYVEVANANRPAKEVQEEMKERFAGPVLLMKNV